MTQVKVNIAYCYWPAPPDDPQGIRVASVIEFSVCVFVFMFVYKVFTIPILISYWPTHPDDPQGIRVASVIEFSVCLSVCLFVYVFWANFLIFFCSIRPLRFNKTLRE